MITYAYDIECLMNLFTATFVNVKDKSDVRYFYVGVDKEDYSDLINFLKEEMVLVGYNNHSYDDPMLRFIIGYEGERGINLELHKLSERLVNDACRMDKDIMKLRYPKDIKYPWKTIDLMKLLAFDKMGISLKQTSINLKWYKVQDMPIDHTSYVKKEDIETILSYNLNDVLITERLYWEIEPQRELRRELSKMYHVDLSSASNSKMGNIILEHFYAEQEGVDIREVRKQRTVREKVLLGDCIAPYVTFKSQILRDLFDRISVSYVYKYNNYKYSEKISYAGCKFSLGVGGLHTEDAPGMFVSDDKYLIQDMDVSSYYPNLIINNNFYPEHLGTTFIDVLKKMTQERISAKKAYNEYKHRGEQDTHEAKFFKMKMESMKITINSIFGKLGSEYFWLLDVKQMFSTTLTGQLSLLMLVERLHSEGISVISCNTDGIVCKIPREKLDEYYRIAEEWEKETNLELEFTPYKKYVRRDVNSYITLKEDGESKEKGAFVKKVQLEKSYSMPIVPMALYEYYINDVPVRKTIESSRDIMDFCISQKTGGKFSVELHTSSGVEVLQKTNRYYITRKGGSLFKRYNGRLTGMNVGRLVRILNNYDENIPFEDYDVDFSFYEKEAMKIINEIEPLQDSLFDLTKLSDGGIIQNKEFESKQRGDKKFNVHDLNKLAIGTFDKTVAFIVNSEDTIQNINPRFVFVTKLDKKAMSAELYCFLKGTSSTIKIEKGFFKKNPFSENDILYCKKFNVTSGEYTLTDYTKTRRFIKEEERMI